MGNETPVMKIPIPYPSSSAIDELFDYDRFLVDAFSTVDAMKVIGSTQIRNAAQYTNLQTALNELGSLGGGILYVPKGTYNIGDSTTLSVPANVWIIGADAVFKSQTDTTTSTASFFSVAGDNVRFVGIQFLGSETQQGFVRPAVETNGRSVEFYRCQFIGVRTVRHLHSSNSGTAVFKECLFRNLWGDWVEANSPLVFQNCRFLKTNKLVSTNATYRERGTAIRLPINKAISVNIDNCFFDGILRSIIWFSGATASNFLELNITNTKATNYGVGHFGTQAEVDAEWAVVVSEHDGLGRFITSNDTTLYADVNITNCVVEGTSALFLPNNVSDNTIRQGVLRVVGTRMLRTGLKPTTLSPLVFIRTGNGLFVGSHLDDAAQNLTGHRAFDLFAASSGQDRTPHLFIGCFLGRSAMAIDSGAVRRWSAINCTFTFGSGGLPNTFNLLLDPDFAGTSITDAAAGWFMVDGTGNLPPTDTMGYLFRGHPGSTDVSLAQVRFKVHNTADVFEICGGGFMRSYRYHRLFLSADAFRRGSSLTAEVVEWGTNPAVPIPTIRFPHATSYTNAHAASVVIPADSFIVKASAIERPRISLEIFVRVSGNMATNEIPRIKTELYRIPKGSNTPSLIFEQTFDLGSSFTSTTGNLLRKQEMVINASNQTNAGDGMWVLVVRRVAGTNDSSFTIDLFGAELTFALQEKPQS